MDQEVNVCKGWGWKLLLNVHQMTAQTTHKPLIFLLLAENPNHPATVLLFLRKPLFVNGEMESLMGRLVFGCYITSLCIFTLQWNWLEPLSNSRSLGHSVFYEWMTVCILFPWVFYFFSSFFPQSNHGGLDHWTDRRSDVKVTGHLFLFVVLGPITDVSGCSMENVSLPGLPAVQIYFVLKISKAVILKVGGTFF